MRFPARALVPLLRGRVLFAVRTRASQFALTLDDGPDASTTPAVLDVLRRHGARATFFLLGSTAAREPDLVARIVREGHELGNHTWADEPTWRLAEHEFREKLWATQRTLEQHARPHWFRPGSGWPTPRHLALAEDGGLRCVLGSAVALGGHGAGTAGTVRRLDAVTRRGAIVVLHEGPGRRAVVGTVDALLERTSRRGLAAVTLSELVRGGSRGYLDAII